MVSTEVATVLLFNAAKVLAEQQINTKIETIYFTDGLVQLVTQDTIIEIEIGITPSLQSSSSLCPGSSRIAGELIDDEIQSPSVSSTQPSEDNVEITKTSTNKSVSATGTPVRKQPIRNVSSVYASHPYPRQRRKASVKNCRK